MMGAITFRCSAARLGAILFYLPNVISTTILELVPGPLFHYDLTGEQLAIILVEQEMVGCWNLPFYGSNNKEEVLANSWDRP